MVRLRVVSRSRETGERRLKAESPRTFREQRTVEVMVRMYCAHYHAAGAGDHLCPECAALMEYSREQVDACRFGERKPTCARCTVHCFRREMREQIRTVMRHSGPRMTFRHPYLAMRHMLDRRKA